MNRVAIRITSDGLSLLVALALVFFAAFNTGANLVYLVASLIMALYLLSLVHCLRGFPGLDGTLRVPTEVVDGQHLAYSIRLNNTSRRTYVLLRAGLRLNGTSPLPTRAIFTVTPGERVDLSCEVPAPMRGAYTIAGLVVQSVFPAGLVVREECRPVRGEVVVLPGPLKHPFPVFAGFDQRATWADTGSSVKGEGTAFYGLREYVVGDPIRKIHWKATARTGKAMVVEQEEDRVNKYFVFMDLRASRKVGTGSTSNLEVTIRLGTMLALQLLKLNCPVRIFLLDGKLTRVPSSFSSADIPQALRFMGRLEYTADEDFSASIRRVLPEVPTGAYLLFVLNDLDSPTLALLEGLVHSPHALFCILNLQGPEAIAGARADSRVQRLMQAGTQVVFFDALEEQVAGA